MTTSKQAYLNGIEYQARVADRLRRHGYSVSNSAQGGQHGCDLLVNGMPVEVKGSRLHPLHKNGNGFSWLLHRTGKPRGVDGKVLILLADIGNGEELFIMPAHTLDNQHYIELRFDGEPVTQSKLWQWLNRFDVIDDELNAAAEIGYPFELDLDDGTERTQAGDRSDIDNG